MSGYITSRGVAVNHQYQYWVNGVTIPTDLDPMDIVSIQADGHELDQILSICEKNPGLAVATADLGKRVQTWEGASARRLYVLLTSSAMNEIDEKDDVFLDMHLDVLFSERPNFDDNCSDQG